MDEKKMNSPVRTKEEILSWLNAALKRKEAWEKKVDEKFAKRMQGKKQAAESGYYELEWVQTIDEETAMFNSMKP